MTSPRVARVKPDDECECYWGSHGCSLPRYHGGSHQCQCCECDVHPEPGCVGAAPYYGWLTWFFGDDRPRIRMAIIWLPREVMIRWHYYWSVRRVRRLQRREWHG